MSDERKLFIPTNGIDATTGSYLLPPLTVEHLAHVARDDKLNQESEQFQVLAAKTKMPLLPAGRGPATRLALPEGLDADNLSQAGWGIIFAQSDERAPSIREALYPLLKYRRKQAGRHYREFSGADAYQPGETKQAFLKRHGIDFGPVDPDKGVPYYLLIVGSPVLIPYRFQYELDVQFAVGRIHFDSLNEYENYARSVVAAETGHVLLPRTATFFGVHNPDDMATAAGADHLVAPLATLMREEQPRWNIQTILKEDATKARLSSILGSTEAPALFFGASHGVGFPPGHPRQLPHQGALLCQDWPGPREWRKPVPHDFYFAGDDLDPQANLLGTIAFFFVCFGAGTPKLDDFSRQAFSHHRDIAPHAFLASLPRRMLSHPKGGALAVVGHVERAWGYSSLLENNQKEKQRQLLVFARTLLRLMERSRLGFAFDYFNGRYAEISITLNRVLHDIEQGEPLKPMEMAVLWITSHDARNYVVIGDPAVRLAVGNEANNEVRRPDISTVNIPLIDTSKLTRRIARAVLPTSETHPGILSRSFSATSSNPATPPLHGRATTALLEHPEQPAGSTSEEPPVPTNSSPSSPPRGQHNPSPPPSSPPPPSPPPAAPTTEELQPAPRVIKTWIEGLARDEPLRLTTTYELKFRVDTSPDEARSGVTALLRSLQSDERHSDVLVVLDTDDVTIYGEQQQTLVLPREGASKNTITFCIEPQKLGRAVVRALCFTNGRLCQKLTLTLQVGEGSTKATPTSMRVHASGMTLDSGIARSLRSTSSAPALTLVLHKKTTGYRCILHHHQQQQESVQPTSVLRAHLPFDETQLADLVVRARDDLHFLTLFRLDGESVYRREDTTIPAEVHSAVLRTLASLGHHLYQQLFYAPGSGADSHAVGERLRQLSQQQPLDIEIAADTFVVPWDMLYDCDPTAANRVEPEGFWGFRHIVQQMPEFRSHSPVSFVPEVAPAPGEAAAGASTLAVSFAYDSTLEHETGHTVVQNQRTLLQNLPAVRLDERPGHEDLAPLLGGKEMSGTHLVYCYCRARSHIGRHERVAASALIFSDGELALDAVMSKPETPPAEPPLSQAPFVLLNICQSPGFTPYVYEELVPHLLNHGARGVLGTVLDVPPFFAAEFAQEFLRRFLSGGQPAGELLRGLRREYLAQHNNALGLLYALYSSGEVVVPRVQEEARATPTSPAAVSFGVLGGGAEAATPPPPSSPEVLGGVSFGLFGWGESDEEGPSAIEQARDYLSKAIQDFATRLGETLKKSISEVTTLEVSTYVSDEVHRNLEEASLRAFTRVRFDGDTEACVPRYEGEIDADLWQMHLDMVERAQTHRAELLKTLTEAASGLFDVLK